MGAYSRQGSKQGDRYSAFFLHNPHRLALPSRSEIDKGKSCPPWLISRLEVHSKQDGNPMGKLGSSKPCTSLWTILIHQKSHKYICWSCSPYHHRPSKTNSKPDRRLENILLMKQYGFDTIRLWQRKMKLLLDFSWLWCNSRRLRMSVKYISEKWRTVKRRGLLKMVTWGGLLYEYSFRNEMNRDGLLLYDKEHVISKDAFTELNKYALNNDLHLLILW